MACVPWVIAPPARNAAATRTASAISGSDASNVSSAARQPDSAANRNQPAANLSATKPREGSWLDVAPQIRSVGAHNRLRIAIPFPHTTIDRVDLKK